MSVCELIHNFVIFSCKFRLIGFRTGFDHWLAAWGFESDKQDKSVPAPATPQCLAVSAQEINRTSGDSLWWKETQRM